MLDQGERRNVSFKCAFGAKISSDIRPRTLSDLGSEQFFESEAAGDRELLLVEDFSFLAYHGWSIYVSS